MEEAQIPSQFVSLLQHRQEANVLTPYYMKNNIKKCIVALYIIGFTPVIAFADIANLNQLINELLGLANSLVPLLFGLALLAFIWGVIGYIWSADPKRIKDARNYMIFSVVGMAVMMSIWGLSLFLKNSFFPSATITFDPSSSK